ncbi:hypothetical protein [Streptomyces kronopolitis]|uniref:hypothetical protein n=1 Tax=Streptomyces kronopolitis TaxID=1612435 RepID=UPI003D978D43
MILTSGRYDAAGEWHSNPAWDDLRNVVMIALRRTTPTHLIEILSSSVKDAADVGRLAAWRCWKLINFQRNQDGYRKRPAVPVGAKVALWDVASPAELQRHRERAEAAHRADVQARRREEHERRRQEVETRHRLFLQRLGIDPDARREPEHVHREQYPEPVAARGPVVPEDFDELTPQQRAQVAAARARAERARRGKAPRKSRTAAATEARQEENTRRLMQRLQARTTRDEQ